VVTRDPNSNATGASGNSADGDRPHNDILHAALIYAKRGWAVLPLWWVRTDDRCACDSPNCDSVGKHPIGKSGMAPNGVNSAAINTSTIRAWWRRYPLANVGIATGKRSGLWVLDVDGPEGAATLTDLEHRHGSLPTSIMAQTGGGGQHRVFSFHGENIKNRVKDIGDGLDVRATGGYIVAPPSIHKNGAVYQWMPGLGPDAIEPADAPSWLIEQVSGGNRRQRERPPDQDRQQDHQQDKRSMNGHGQPSGGSVDAWVAKALENEIRAVEQTGKGGRNDQLNRSAFSLGQLVGGEHLREDPVVKALFGAATRNGSVADDGEVAVMATINSGLKGGKDNPRKKPEPEPRTEQKRQDAGSKSNGSKPNGANGSAGKAGNGAEEDVKPRQTSAEPPLPLADFLSSDHWRRRALSLPEPLLGEMIVNTTRMFLGGQTGLGKTHLIMAMGGAMGAGSGFLHWTSSRPARVLMIDGEMPRDLVQERLNDLYARMGVDELPNLFVFCREDAEDLAQEYPELGEMQPLNSEAGRKWLLRLIDIMGGVDVVILDNRMSLLAGDMKDEVPWTDTMPLVKELTQRRIAQIWIDHTGHDAGHIYGTKTKEWQFDTVALMEKAERPGAEIAFTLSFSKARRRKPSNRSDFDTVTVTLANDEWTVEGATSTRSKGKVSAMAAAFHDGLVNALVITPTPGSATRDLWYLECVRLGLADSIHTDDSRAVADRKRSKLRKYIAELKAAGWIGVNGETVRSLVVAPAEPVPNPAEPTPNRAASNPVPSAEPSAQEPPNHGGGSAEPVAEPLPNLPNQQKPMGKQNPLGMAVSRRRTPPKVPNLPNLKNRVPNPCRTFRCRTCRTLPNPCRTLAELLPNLRAEHCRTCRTLPL
jgi:hypothetical protein